MSAFHSDKCSNQEIWSFKSKVIDFLINYGIDVTKLDIRSYHSYNGDVKVFTGEYMEMPNRKSSFRRSSADKNDKGDIIGYSGTRGKHTTKYSVSISFNRDEWDEMIKLGKDDLFWKDFIYDKLDALKDKQKSKGAI